MLLQQPTSPPGANEDASESAPWPPEVDLILSAMDVARSSHAPSPLRLIESGADVAVADVTGDRRRSARAPYRTRASLKLYADPAGAEPRTLYSRDVDRRGMGFITPHLLPLGYGGWVTLRSPDGEEVRIECTIYRCRKTVQGWYEGAVKFHREAWQFG